MAASIQELDVHFTFDPGLSAEVGTLAQQDHWIFFEYNPQWLKRGLELSPFILPLRPGLQQHSNRQFGPLFGLFDDSLPDGWGLLLMDRHFRKLDKGPAAISVLDRLSYLGERTMGALTYHPSATYNPITGDFDLHQLSRHSQEILAGRTTDILPQLLRAGGSPGGARPKVLVGYNQKTDEIISGEEDLPHGFEHWLVKFSGHDDPGDAGAIEFAYSRMGPGGRH